MKKHGQYCVYLPARKKRWFMRTLNKAARARGVGRSRLMRLALRYYVEHALPEYLRQEDTE